MKTFTHRFLYSSATLIFLYISALDLSAQVTYIDIQPDSTVQANVNTMMASYFLDLNNDLTLDFEIRHFYPDASNAAIELHPAIQSEVITLPSTGITDFPVAMDSLDEISDAGNFKGNSTTFYLNNEAGNRGDWVNSETKYLGLRIKIGGQWHYGWCELFVPTNADRFVIKSYAFEGQPDTPILAGNRISTGIKKIDQKFDYQIYLQNQWLYIAQKSHTSTAKRLSILNTKGQVILSKQLGFPQEKVNAEELTPGIYFIAIYSQGQVQTSKVMIP